MVAWPLPVALCVVTPAIAFLPPPSVTWKFSVRNRNSSPWLLPSSLLEIDLSNESNGTDTVITPEVVSSTASLDIIPAELLTLPRHSNSAVNDVLEETEHLIRSMHSHAQVIQDKEGGTKSKPKSKSKTKPRVGAHDAIFANTYVVSLIAPLLFSSKRF